MVPGRHIIAVADVTAYSIRWRAKANHIRYVLANCVVLLQSKTRVVIKWEAF